MSHYCYEKVTGSCSFEPKNCKVINYQQFYINPYGFQDDEAKKNDISLKNVTGSCSYEPNSTKSTS